jgi:hypothetical protein
LLILALDTINIPFLTWSYILLFLCIVF